MVHSSCTKRPQVSGRKQLVDAKTSFERRRPATRHSAELIEQTRKLMEQTIEFVHHPIFESTDPSHQLLAIRPDSIDRSVETTETAPGLAFVSGLVQMPLLSAEEERYWFIWMNFLKWRAEHNRKRLDLNYPDQSLIDQIQSDLRESLQVRNRIVQGNLRLIVALSRKLTGSLEQMSDLISEGMMPLLRSVELFDISLGNRFSTYATWAVRNQMLRLLKRIGSSPERSTRDDSVPLESLPDHRVAQDSAVTDPEIRLQIVNRLLSSLTPRERAVITARYGLEGHPHGQSLADIGLQLGLSKERVRQIVLSTISKLKNEVSDHEI